MKHFAAMPSTIFLNYQSPVRGQAVILDNNGSPQLLSVLEQKEWADAYRFNGAAFVPADFLHDQLKTNKGFSGFFEALLQLRPLRGVPVCSGLAQGRPCLFLDRDGVIIEDTGYLDRIEELRIIPDVIPMIQWAKSLQWLVIVVSNQSGLARGKFPESFLNTLTQHLSGLLKKDGAEPDAWYYCPYYEQGSSPEFALKSISRKPMPGLILQAADKFSIHMAESFMIGDKMSDLIQLEGLQSLLIQGRYPLESAHKIFADLREALSYLKNATKNRSKPEWEMT